MLLSCWEIYVFIGQITASSGSTSMSGSDTILCDILCLALLGL